MQQQEACVCQGLTCVLSVRSFHVWMHLPEISSPSLHLRLSSPHETVRSCGFDNPRLQDTWTEWQVILIQGSMMGFING